MQFRPCELVPNACLDAAFQILVRDRAHCVGGTALLVIRMCCMDFSNFASADRRRRPEVWMNPDGRAESLPCKLEALGLLQANASQNQKTLDTLAMSTRSAFLNQGLSGRICPPQGPVAPRC